MSTDEVTNGNTGSTSPLADVTDDSGRLQVTDIVSLTTDAARECGSGNLCFEVKPEVFPTVKQEPDDLCGLQFTKTVPFITDGVCSSTTECDSSILCFQVKPEVLEAVKQEPDDLCGLQFTETVPLTTDDVCSSTTECGSKNLCFQVKTEILEVAKQELDYLQV